MATTTIAYVVQNGVKVDHGDSMGLRNCTGNVKRVRNQTRTEWTHHNSIPLVRFSYCFASGMETHRSRGLMDENAASVRQSSDVLVLSQRGMKRLRKRRRDGAKWDRDPMLREVDDSNDGDLLPVMIE